MRSEAEIAEILAPLAYRATDKLFKFISWAGIVAILKYANSITDNTGVSIIFGLANTAFVLALMSQAFYLGVRKPKTLGIPDEWAAVSKAVQIFICFAMFLFISSPYLFLDQIIDSFINVKN